MNDAPIALQIIATARTRLQVPCQKDTWCRRRRLRGMAADTFQGERRSDAAPAGQVPDPCPSRPVSPAYFARRLID
jgi:hypothetical protein